MGRTFDSWCGQPYRLSDLSCQSESERGEAESWHRRAREIEAALRPHSYLAAVRLKEKEQAGRGCWMLDDPPDGPSRSYTPLACILLHPRCTTARSNTSTYTYRLRT